VRRPLEVLLKLGVIEQAIGKLKRFKRIALRCEKTARNYGSFVALALGFILVKSVYTPQRWRPGQPDGLGERVIAYLSCAFV